MVKREDLDQIAVLRMEHGKVNALDIDLCRAIVASLDEVEKSNANAVVLTGTGATFSAGVDLVRLLNSSAEYVSGFVPELITMLERLFLFPKPVVAAVNGNAIAGGCIIECACDYRIGSIGDGRIGVPELLVGVAFPPIALEIVRFAVNPTVLQQVVYFGRYYSMEESVKVGFLDELVTADQLTAHAHGIAVKLSQLPADAFRIVKLQLRDPYMKTVRQSPYHNEVKSVWTSPDTHDIIRQYLSRTIGKQRGR